MVSSLTEQLHSHSASPMEDSCSHLSKGIWASHVEISAFVAWENGDERLLRPLTWVCFLLWDDDYITHHMYHLSAPGDPPRETQWATEIISYFRAFGFPMVSTTTAKIPPWEFGSWILKMIFTLKFQRRVTMLLQGYVQSEILCFYNKLVLKGLFWFGFFALNVALCWGNTLKWGMKVPFQGHLPAHQALLQEPGDWNSAHGKRKSKHTVKSSSQPSTPLSQPCTPGV